MVLVAFTKTIATYFNTKKLLSLFEKTRQVLSHFAPAVIVIISK